jgi:hypothetical protein
MKNKKMKKINSDNAIAKEIRKTRNIAMALFFMR